MPKLKTLLIPLLLTTAISLPALAEDVDQISSTADDRTDIRITIDNGNLAAVSETRTLTLARGLNNIEFADVSARSKTCRGVCSPAS